MRKLWQKLFDRTIYVSSEEQLPPEELATSESTVESYIDENGFYVELEPDNEPKYPACG